MSTWTEQSKGQKFAGSGIISHDKSLSVESVGVCAPRVPAQKNRGWLTCIGSAACSAGRLHLSVRKSGAISLPEGSGGLLTSHGSASVEELAAAASVESAPSCDIWKAAMEACRT